MKRLAILIMFLICYDVTASSAQEPTPTLLVHAAHCLEVKQFLPQPKQGIFTLGYFLDEQSYPGDKVMYVVAFGNSHTSNGDVFVVFLSTKSGRNDFNIQNNATFSLTKDNSQDISFINPPLGGIWTHKHIASAIQTIEKQPRYTVSMKDLLAKSDVTCESYSDNQL